VPVTSTVPVATPTSASAIDLTTTPPTVTNFVLDILPSGAVTQLALAPNGKRAYITSNAGGESHIQVIGTDPGDSATFNKKLQLIDTSVKTLQGITFTADGAYAYVASANASSREMVVVNTAND